MDDQIFEEFHERLLREHPIDYKVEENRMTVTVQEKYGRAFEASLVIQETETEEQAKLRVLETLLCYSMDRLLLREERAMDRHKKEATVRLVGRYKLSGNEIGTPFKIALEAAIVRFKQLS